MSHDIAEAAHKRISSLLCRRYSGSDFSTARLYSFSTLHLSEQIDLVVRQGLACHVYRNRAHVYVVFCLGRRRRRIEVRGRYWAALLECAAESKSDNNEIICYAYDRRGLPINQ